MNWNHDDECRVAQLRNELVAMENRRGVAVRRLADVIGLVVDPERTFNLGDAEVQSALRHAVELRDALAPFDSGVRDTPAAPHGF